jgi:sugar-specific transcriptional regulator TrmB
MENRYMPLESRLKEIEYQDKLNYSKILSNQNEIYNEIDSMIDQTRKELLIFSSSSLLSKVANQSSFLDNYRKISDKKVALRILVDSADENVLDKFKHINNKSDSAYLIDVGFTEKLGKFNEMLMISDSRYVIQTRYNGNNDKLIASFSNEEHQVLVQEIIFEKYWNEVKGLSNNISTV